MTLVYWRSGEGAETGVNGREGGRVLLTVILDLKDFFGIAVEVAVCLGEILGNLFLKVVDWLAFAKR